MKLGRAIQNTPPILVLGASLLIGVLLVVGSTIVNAGSVLFPTSPPKQLGYYYEINWSLNFVLFVPLALYFFFSAFNCLRTTIRDLAACEMVVGADGKALTEATLQADWQRISGRAIVAAAILAVVALSASWIEWWMNFHYSLGQLGDVLANTGLGPGWNLAPLVNPPHHILTVKAFGFLAYTMQGIVASAYIGFLSIMFGFSTWIYQFTTEITGAELVPCTTSDDERRGFENFELLIETLLFASLCCFGIFFLTRLDHAFLASPSVNLSAFVQQDLWWGFIHGFKELAKGSPSLFDTGAFGYSIEMTGIGLVLSLVTCFFVPVIILRQAARESKRRLLMRTQDNTIRSVLKSMVFWPIQYPGPMQLLGFLFLAAWCFLFYKLTLVLIAATLAAIIAKFAKSITNSR